MIVHHGSCFVLPSACACGDQSLLLIWSDFHFRPLERISIAFPVMPDDALPPRRLPAGYVSPIQRTLQTAVIPPTSLILLGAVVPAVGILIVVNCREHPIIVIGKAVT